MPNEMLDIRLTVSNETQNISLEVDRKWKEIGIEVDRGGATILPYEGPYYVKPTFYWQQRLSTFGKQMLDDVLVDSIKVTETHNPQGGKTIVIG